MPAKKHLALILILLLFLPLLSACGESGSKKTVRQFLTAYKANDQAVLDRLMKEPGSLGKPYVIEGLPETVVSKYNDLFVDFSFDIEREEVSDGQASVYVKMTYKDAGNPSVAAFNDFQSKASLFDPAAVSESEIMALLEDTFLTALSGELEPIEEILVVPLEQNAEGQWLVAFSGEFENALTANMGVMVSAIEDMAEEMGNVTD